MKKSVSLASEYPELIKEWHPQKNGLLSPENVAPKSSKKVWWIQSCLILMKRMKMKNNDSLRLLVPSKNLTSVVSFLLLRQLSYNG